MLIYINPFIRNIQSNTKNYGEKNMSSPIDLSSMINMLTQLLPFILILGLLPMIIKLVTGAFKE